MLIFPRIYAMTGGLFLQYADGLQLQRGRMGRLHRAVRHRGRDGRRHGDLSARGARLATRRAAQLTA